MLIIAGMTFREVLSKKIFYIVLVLTAMFLVVYGIALHFAVQDINKWGGVRNIQARLIFSQLLSLGLYFSTFMVALMAVFSTVGSVSGEIETGTIQAVIAKPLKRSELILGKFLGYTVMMLSYSIVIYLGILGITFISTGYEPSGLFSGLTSFLLIPLLLLVVSLCGSTFLSTMANGIMVFMLYIIGMVGGMVEQIGSMIENTALVNIGILSSLVMPSDALYRKMVFGLLTGPDNPVTAFNPFSTMYPPSGIMTVYTIAYLLIVLFAAIRIFNRRDI